MAKDEKKEDEGRAPAKNLLISRSMVHRFIATHPETKVDEAMMIRWCKLVEKARWATFADIAETVGDVQKVGPVYVSNVCSHKYRYVYDVDFRGDGADDVYMIAVRTHKEYDKEDFK